MAHMGQTCGRKDKYINDSVAGQITRNKTFNWIQNRKICC